MKIEKIEVFTLDLPLAKSYDRPVSGLGGFIRVDTANQVVVKISSNGITGYGLTAPVPHYHGQTQMMMVHAIKYLLPFIKEKNPFDLELIHNTMDSALRGSEPAKCAIDLALHDLLGKILNRPVYSLLGGAQRQQFSTTFTLALGRNGKILSPSEMAQEAQGYYEQGYRAFEVHIGTPGKNYRQDIERIAAIRSQVGAKVEIVSDLHRHWTVKEAISAIRELESHNVYVEQPVEGLEGMSKVCRQVSATIIADESCHTVEDGAAVIHHNAADAFCIKPIKAGGLYKAKKLATLAESFGILTRVDGVPGEGKLSNTASAHLVLTLKHPIVCGVMQHTRLEKDLVTQGGLEFTEGHVTLPDKPGLGVSVDESLLKPA